MVDQLTFTVQGRRVSVLAAGAARPSTRAFASPTPVLVFLHAFPLHAGMWEPQLAGAPTGWTVLAPDLRGFGGSDLGPRVPSAPSIDDYAHDVLAVLDQLEIAEAVFAGLSLGGYVAFAILRCAPARVAGLVLADTRAEADGVQARAGRAVTLATLERGGAAEVIAAMLPKLLAPKTLTERAEEVTRVRTMLEAADPLAMTDATLRLRDRPDRSPLLASIRCPVLVMGGAEDVLTPVDEMRGLAARVPGARFAVIEGAGHLASLEQPQSFNAELTRFLAAVTERPR
jgi:3-oxoadipate enol-lactonase